VLNVSDGPVDLGGCEVRDAGIDVHVIAGPRVLTAGGRLVFGRSANAVVNGGVAVDVVVAEDVLLDPVDELELHCGGLLIDSVTWTPLWPGAKGVATALSPFHSNAADNDQPSVWCKADAPYGAGGLGTPGGPNAPCPGDLEPLDACRVLGEAALVADAGATLTASAMVLEAGVTDATAAADVASGLRVQGGTGSLGSVPDGAWRWADAAADPTWDAAAAGAPAGEDRWVASWRAPAAGVWSLAFRASADDGHSWTLCDRDGSDGGYDPAQAVSLTCSVSPCDPDPCGAAPPTVCHDDTVVAPEGAATCAVLAGAAACAWPGEAVEDCGAQGASCAAGVCVDFPVAPGPGGLVLSELLIVPAAGPTGEWLEFTNPTESVWSLAGCTLTSAPDEVWVFDAAAADPLVWPGQVVLLARSADPALTEGAPVDAVYSGLSLDNTTDAVTLVCGGAQVTSLGWAPPFAPPVGTSLSLSRGWVLSGADGDLALTCAGPVGTPAGTPGVLNPVCPPADSSIDDCRHGGALAIDADAGESRELAGLVYDAGTTDAWTGNDVAPGLLAQVGYGPVGSDPATQAGWSWVTAEPEGAWDDASEPGWDRWVGTLTVSEPGSWATAWRFTADAGATWSVCDADGAANGYDPTRAGTWEAAPTACLPNPCQAPPDPECEGDTIVVSAGPGWCSQASDGNAVCQYDRTNFDCSPWGGCALADCVGLGSPKSAGDVVVTEILASGAGAAASAAEWVELTNPTGTDFDLRGCALSDGGGSEFVLTGVVPVLIGAGGRLVIAASADAGLNGGLAPDLSWSGLSLGDLLGSLTLRCGGGVIDAVAWGAGWPLDAGLAMQLSLDALDPALNDAPGNWCPATLPYGDGANLGTPGAPNAPCP
jgi:hypothetical protein